MTSTVKSQDIFHNIIHPFTKKKFEMKSRNSVLSVEPAKVYFTFKEVNEVCGTSIKLNNTCGKVLRVYILPLQSKYFIVEPNDKSCLLPGLPLTINIKFAADELRQYNDWLKIVCMPGDNNLMIHLLAEPASPYSNIPRNFNLGSVPLGQTVTTSFMIPSSADKDVEFLMYFPEPSPDFCVEPIAGRVMRNGEPTKVTIKFKPTEYITLQFPIQLYIPQSSKSPFTVTVCADCKPGLARERLQSAQEELVKKKPTVRSRKVTHTATKILHKQQKQQEDDPVEALQKLSTVHGVVKFLLAKEPKKPLPDEMLGPLGRYLSEDHKVYKSKEQKFRREIQKFKSENHAALLHLRDKPGPSLDIDPEFLEQVLTERAAEDEIFQNLLKSGTTAHPDRLQRVIRSHDDVTDTSFTDEPNDMWFVRFQALSRFIQAARRIIIANRLRRRLEALQNAREFIEKEPQKEEEEIKLEDLKLDNIVTEKKSTKQKKKQQPKKRKK